MLVSYQSVLDAVDGLRPLPMVLRRHAGMWRHRPCPKWLLRFFVVHHIDRSLERLSRRYSARAALGLATATEVVDRDAVDEFRKSLPPSRQKVFIALLIVAVIVLCRPIINVLVPVIIRATRAGTPSSDIRQHTLEALEKVGSAFTANFASINDAFESVVAGGPMLCGFVVLSIALATYVVLRPFVPAFRFKRLLFNLAPEVERWQTVSIGWSVPQSGGVYERERRLFHELGVRPPGEVPVDLAVSMLAMALPLTFAAHAIRLAIVLPDGVKPGLIIGTCTLLAVLARLTFLFRIYHCRRLGIAETYRPYDVCVRGAMARMEDPFGLRLVVWLLTCLTLVGSGLGDFDSETTAMPVLQILMFVYLVTAPLSFVGNVGWWCRVNRELRDLDRTYGVTHRRILALIGWLLVVPGLIMFGRRLRRAQVRAGVAPLRAVWALPLGLLFVPALVAILQYQLNKVWTVAGRPIDPWPLHARNTLPHRPFVECATEADSPSLRHTAVVQSP